VLKDGPIKVKKKNSVNIILLAEGTLLNFLVLGNDTFPIHALTFPCMFIMVYPHFVTCENSLQGTHFLHITDKTQHTHFHRCLSVLICKLLWHPPCTYFVIPKVLVAMLGGSLVTMAWHVLRLRMEGSPPGTEGSCKYTE
jgi:hypothetical protein